MQNLVANWPAPNNIKTHITTRLLGLSSPPFEKNNLALHVGDKPSDVLANRRGLVDSLKLPSEPAWLDQTHSNHCVLVDKELTREADAAVTRKANQVLAIMTADCVPILMCDKNGTEVAAIHAGWRGLVNGVIQNTLSALKSPREALMAWVGPCICAACYEVGDEVRSTILAQYPQAESAFQPSSAYTQLIPKWQANLPLLAEIILNAANINAVYQSGLCTYEQEEYFYSYRRAAQTGRIATLIWFT